MKKEPIIKSPPCYANYDANDELCWECLLNTSCAVEKMDRAGELDNMRYIAIPLK
jgi:hypothetical protein